ncbi:MAG: hypothetical protein EAZ89_16990 [Bacteroidetes bacterium]|nr:MAG: hypothetical protein EAZ89_16990 [Bacteroidota bacterium]
MNFTPTEPDWMDYLYGEATPSLQARMEQYLAAHPEAQERLHAWERVRSGLREQAPETDIPVQPLMIHLRPSRRNYGWAIAAALAFLALATVLLSGIRIEKTDTALVITLGQPQPATPDEDSSTRNDSLYQALVALQEASVSASQVQRMLDSLDHRQAQRTRNLLKSTQQEQNDRYEAVFQSFSYYLERQRQSDLRQIQTSFQQMEAWTDRKQQETAWLLTQRMNP